MSTTVRLAPTPCPRRGYAAGCAAITRRRAEPGAAAADVRAPAPRGGSSAAVHAERRGTRRERCGQGAPAATGETGAHRLDGEVRGPGGASHRRWGEVAGCPPAGTSAAPRAGSPSRPTASSTASPAAAAPSRRSGPCQRPPRVPRGPAGAGDEIECGAQRSGSHVSVQGRGGWPARRAPARGRPASRRRPAGSPRLPVSAPARRRRPRASGISTGSERSVRSGQPAVRRAERAEVVRAQPPCRARRRLKLAPPPVAQRRDRAPARHGQPEQATGQGQIAVALWLT
jgi:uncharacterized protein YraI